ncbi:response regulator [Konateibacter massiliensis]|uniref:response regulator n=1 Tax=Konateibacter massiliensis TaxID=2002841 RepID=UPI000C15FE8B|nr:response regulator [Konateibacter massiliensis]
MKTLLIVEDEKMIRQGIKTMVQRSGVPVEVIIECNNGETALEILREQRVDVMFTDIRMSKMDGIELVQRMQELEHKPLTVAISGYDDFSYAVEMMRQGVREYILKPIERQKIIEVLEKLEKEIVSTRESERASRKIGYQQFKYLMINENVTEEEMNTLREQYEKDFFGGTYYICCRNTGKIDKMRDSHIYLQDIEGNDVFIVTQDNLKLLLKNELAHAYIGISGEHNGIGELQKAYKEAVKARRRAFCTNQETMHYEKEYKRIPEQMLEEASKRMQEEERLQRVQLLGTDKTEEVLKIWNKFFYVVKNESLSETDFESGMQEFFEELAKTYRNSLPEEAETIERLKEIFSYSNLSAYEEEFMNWLLAFHDKISIRFDANKNKQKISEAVEYIRKNYYNDLNMAVVSNHISMNYSLFSHSFKQYTGNNFVHYLKNIRMEEAKKLLEETDMRVNEISQKVGYDNEKHFMKLFKSACGVSPSEYRKNMKLK